MKWSYIILSYLSLLCLSIFDNGRGPSYPSILNHFSIETSQGSYIYSLTSLSALFVTLSSRYWIARFGIIIPKRIALLILSFCCFAIPFAANKVEFKLMLLDSIIAGVALGTMMISMNLIIAKSAPVHLRRKLFSGLHAIYGLSALLTPYLFTYFKSLRGKWDDYFYFVGIAVLIIFIYSLFVDRMKSQNPSSNQVFVPLRFLKRMPYGLMISTYVTSEVILSSRLVLYLEKEFLYSNFKAGQFLSLFFLFLTIGRFIFSLKHFNVSNEKLLVFSHIISLVSFFLGTFIHPFFYSLCGLTMSFFFPTFMDLLSHRFHEGIEFMTSSINAYIGIMLGSFHIVFGMIAKILGLKIAFFVTPFCTMTSLIILVFFVIPDHQNA